MYSDIKHIPSVLVFLAVALIRMNSADEEIKYDINYDRTESFNGTDQFYKFNFYVSKKDDTKNVFTIDGSLETLQDLDDDWKLAIELFKLNENNEYESVFAIPKIGICNFMRTIYKKYFYDKISEYSNLPHYDTCPTPAGKYEIKQYPHDMAIFKRLRHVITPGNYRLQQFLVQNDVAVSGVLFYGNVVKKS